MARAKGRDVMLELMEAVARLEGIATEHSEHFEMLATQVTLLARGARASREELGRVARLIVRLADDHQRIEGLEERMDKLERKAG